MKELLQKTLSLPNLSINEDELSKLIEFIQTVCIDNNKTFQSAFLEKCKEDNFILPKNVPIISSYLDAWEQMRIALEQWNNYLMSICSTFPEYSTEQNYLTPLIIEFLPSNLSQLTQLNKHLEFAFNLESQTQTAAFVINYLNAVKIKIESLTSKNTLPSSQIIVVQNTLSEINAREKVNSLMADCETLKNSLLKLFEKTLKENDRFAYLRYYKNGRSLLSHDHIINDIAEDLEYEREFALEPNEPSYLLNAELIPLLKKYLIMKDIFTTLKYRRTNAIDQLNEFNEKLSQHIELFQNDPICQAFLNTLTPLIPAATAKPIVPPAPEQHYYSYYLPTFLFWHQQVTPPLPPTSETEAKLVFYESLENKS